ncbi:MAG: hypothetical protein OXG46_09985 [Chloroflexi bacterium]|nr:hypothetical protein [Chloroflexota bacterium]MCY3937345.1 hypothetical protein [Chloroflexota bacterium]
MKYLVCENSMFGLKADELLFEKQVRQGRDGWWWMSDNPSYPPMRSEPNVMEVWGQVRWSMRRFNNAGH